MKAGADGGPLNNMCDATAAAAAAAAGVEVKQQMTAINHHTRGT